MLMHVDDDAACAMQCLAACLPVFQPSEAFLQCYCYPAVLLWFDVVWALEACALHSVVTLLCCCQCCCLQGYLLSQPKTKTFKNVKVDAYLFAAANVGNADFVEDFNDLVNARR